MTTMPLILAKKRNLKKEASRFHITKRPCQSTVWQVLSKSLRLYYSVALEYIALQSNNQMQHKVTLSARSDVHFLIVNI